MLWGLRPGSSGVASEPRLVEPVLTPGTIGRGYFEEVAEAVSGPGRPDPARLQAIMLRHGLVPSP